MAEPGSAAAGNPRLLAGVSQAAFEIRAAGAASASGAAAITPDGATVFVTNPDSGSVSAVNTRTDEKAGEVAVGADPRSLALGPEARRLYVTSQRSAMLAVLDPERLAVLATIPVGPEPYGVVAESMSPRRPRRWSRWWMWACGRSSRGSQWDPSRRASPSPRTAPGST